MRVELRNHDYAISELDTLHKDETSHWAGSRPLRDFVARAPTSRSACGGALNDEISHAARAFSLLLAGGALAHAMKLTAGGRGSFTFEGLYRSSLLTAFKCKSPALCAELHDVCGEDEIRTRGTVNPYVSLANWWFQPLTHLSGNAFLREIR